MKQNAAAAQGVDIGTIDLQHDINSERFLAALFEADDVGAMVRCHYEAEQAINYVLDKLTGGRSKRKAVQWSFAQKLEVCHLLGIGENWLSPIKTHNGVRNDFAHKGLDEIDDQMVLDMVHLVRKLYPAFDDKFRLTVTGKRSFDKTYVEASLKERYVMCMMIAVFFLSSVPQVEQGLRAGTIVAP